MKIINLSHVLKRSCAAIGSGKAFLKRIVLNFFHKGMRFAVFEFL